MPHVATKDLTPVDNKLGFELFGLKNGQSGFRMKSKYIAKPGIVFRNGVYKAEYQEIADELFWALANAPAVARLVQHVSLEEAERRAQAAMTRMRLGGGVTGTNTSAGLRAYSQELHEAQNKQLDAVMQEPVDGEEMREEIRKDDLLLTEAANLDKQVDNTEGFTPDPASKPLAEQLAERAADEPATFAALAPKGA